MGGFKIDEFRLSQIRGNTTILTIAMRGSGKSVLCQDLLHHMRDIPCGVVVAPTEEMNNCYGGFFPDLFIHSEVNDLLFQKLLLRQTIMVKKWKDYKKQGKVVDPRVLLLMDDCLADSGGWKKMAGLRRVLMNGRHYHITYILTMQYAIGIGPELRANFDYIFLLNEDNKNERVKLYKNYVGIFPSQTAFEKVFDKCTEDYGCMVIVRKGNSKKIEDKIFWFKATADRQFQFGSREFWGMHEDYYDPDFLERNLLNAVKPPSSKNEIEVLLR